MGTVSRIIFLVADIHYQITLSRDRIVAFPYKESRLCLWKSIIMMLLDKCKRRKLKANNKMMSQCIMSYKINENT